MKKLLLVSGLAVAGLVAYGQGTVNFNNRVTVAGIDAKILDPNGAALDGTAWLAQLYFGLPGAAEGSLTPVADAPVAFRTGAAAGYVAVGALGARALSGIALGGPAVVQIRAWNASAGATYDAALANPAGIVGKSALVSIAKTGGSGEPPEPPANLVGLTGFSLAPAVIPEPATIALGLLGAGVLFLRRRK